MVCLYKFIIRLILMFVVLNPLTSSITHNFRIAVLLPEYHSPQNLTTLRPNLRAGLRESWPYFIQMVMPGVEIAQTKMKKLLPNIRFEIQANNSFCRGSNSMVASVILKDDFKNDAFFGPGCEYSAAPVARFMPVWEKLIITGGALSAGFNIEDQEIDKRFLTRIQGSYSKFAEFLIHICQTYEWKHIALIYEVFSYFEKTDCRMCLGAVNKLAMENNITISEATTGLDLRVNKAEEVVANIPNSARSKYHYV